MTDTALSMTLAVCQESPPRWSSNTAIYTVPDASLERLMPEHNPRPSWEDTFVTIASAIVFAAILAVLILSIYGFILKPLWEYIT